MARTQRSLIVLYGVRAAFWAAVIFAFVDAEMPASHAPQLFPWDKAEHFTAFFVLACLAAAAYPRASLIVMGLWLTLFGSLIELVQALPIVRRDCDVWDWVADTIAVCAAFAPMLIDRWRRHVSVSRG